MLTRVIRLWRCDRAATSIEYAIIAAIMAVMLVAVLESLSANLSDKWNSVADGFKE